MKGYDYVFCKYYKLAKIITNSYYPELNATFATTVLQGLNILFLIDIVNRFVFSLPKWLTDPSDIQMIICILLLFEVNDFLYTRGDKPKEIERKYSKETDKERKRGNIIVVTYTVLSVISMFIITIMNRK